MVGVLRDAEGLEDEVVGSRRGLVVGQGFQGPVFRDVPGEALPGVLVGQALEFHRGSSSSMICDGHMVI